MASSKVGRRSLAYLTAVATILALAIPFIGTANAAHGGATNTTIDVNQISLTPDSATMPSGSCVTFTLTASNSGAAAESETIDVTVSISDDDNPGSTTGEVVDLTAAWCDPDGTGAATQLTHTPQGAGAGSAGNLTDTDDDGNAENAATIFGSCFTNASAQCVFGVVITDSGASGQTGGTGTVKAFADVDNSNTHDPTTEASDTSTITVGGTAGGSVTSVVCTPDAQTKSEGGTTDTFTCTASAGTQNIGGAQIIFDVTAGPNSEEIGATNCGSVTNSQGQATCSYSDTGNNTAASPAGTDTVTFCVNQANPTPGGAVSTTCDTHEPKDTSSVNWVGNANSVTCTPDGATVTPGGNVLFSCAATDANNNAVGSGVTITMTKAGPGVVSGGTASGGSCTTTATSNSCTLQVTTSTNESGTITVTGSYSGAGTNCTAGTPPTPNTGTTATCTDTATATVANPTVAPPTEVDHARGITLNFKHVRLPRAGGGTKRWLKASGNVSTDNFQECISDVPVKVQIRAGGSWITRKSDTTNDNGSYAVLITDTPGKYRAVASRFEISDDNANEIHNCLRAAARRTHRHG